MKITLQPDPKCLEVIRNDKKALELSINLLKALGALESGAHAWDKAHQLELDPEKIIGGTGLSEGWSEMKTVPGFYAKTGLRFDWARFNHLLSALEFGFTFDYYSQTIVQMVDVKGRTFFPTGYVSLVFGKRK